MIVQRSGHRRQTPSNSRNIKAKLTAAGTNAAARQVIVASGGPATRKRRLTGIEKQNSTLFEGARDRIQFATVILGRVEPFRPAHGRHPEVGAISQPVRSSQGPNARV
jgi:hypothetical protein